MLTVAQLIFHADVDLAVAYSLSLQLRRDGIAEQQNRIISGGDAWGLMDYAERLREIAKNERKFLGMSDEETGFNPDNHTGEVTVATMHGAKGLEWDRVYLMSVNNYSFPSGEPGDSFIGEKWFARDELNVEAEARAQLQTLYDSTPYIEGQATNGCAHGICGGAAAFALRGHHAGAGAIGDYVEHRTPWRLAGGDAGFGVADVVGTAIERT